ncbi:SGNH/GDSL hydrolase family protein [Variovorax guangxiensis]|uniref:SGNH/GDSL hydrolase family protein n=1 Tax=Variovorax guangxiensis TaxID=1775474 RepID=A0A3S0XXC6_9BURK|nr:SGNH/GDSL hydrolase family protein [Variovorax guangxiensis]RUR71879.1 SGNH/GDSL hydrolase family protein [Variovorax guangxiensis]
MFVILSVVAAVNVGCGGGGGGGGGGAAMGMLPVASTSVPATAAAPAQDSGASSSTASPVDCSVTLYGDSILYGGTNITGAGPGRLQEPPAVGLVRIRPLVTVSDRTEPGDYATRRLPFFMNDRITSRFVVIEHGLNDAGNGFDYETPLRTMVQRVKALQKTAIVTGLSHVREGVDQRDAYDAIASRVAKEEGVAFANWGSVPFTRDSTDFADDVHPAQPYSTRLTEQLARTIDGLAPECR